MYSRQSIDDLVFSYHIITQSVSLRKMSFIEET